jgi:PAS domain S-box-containing protein
MGPPDVCALLVKPDPVVHNDPQGRRITAAARNARRPFVGDTLGSGRETLQEDLRLTRARSEAILNASLDAIVSMDHEGRIGEFNPAAEKLFGYSRADAVGKPLADLIIPERLRAQHDAGLKRYLANGGGPVVNRRIEMPALRADGSEFPVELAIVPVAGAQPPLFIGFIRDITDRKLAE